MISARQALEHALKEIETKGWVQGGHGGGSSRVGACCASVALIRATNDVSDVPAYDKARQVFVSLLPKEYEDSIIVWNDAPERTKAQVVKKFREAIASLAPVRRRRRR